MADSPALALLKEITLISYEHPPAGIALVYVSKDGTMQTRYAFDPGSGIPCTAGAAMLLQQLSEHLTKASKI